MRLGFPLGIWNWGPVSVAVSCQVLVVFFGGAETFDLVVLAGAPMTKTEATRRTAAPASAGSAQRVELRFILNPDDPRTPSVERTAVGSSLRLVARMAARTSSLAWSASPPVSPFRCRRSG